MASLIVQVVAQIGHGLIALYRKIANRKGNRSR